MARDLLPLTKRINAELLKRRWPAVNARPWSVKAEDIIMIREPGRSLSLFVGNDFIDITAMRKGVTYENRRVDVTKHSEDEAVYYVMNVFEDVWESV